MKKLYMILAAAALGLSAQARELTWYDGDTKLEAGSTFTFNDVETRPAGNMQQVSIEPNLYLGTDIYSSKITVSATANEKIELCAGGACETGESITKTGVKINGGQSIPLQLHYNQRIPADQEVPRIVVDLTAQMADYPETLTTLTVVMNGDQDGVTAIVNGYEFYSTPDGLHYNIDTPAQLSLYGITGMKVLQTTVSGSGVIATDGIPAGIYVYTLGGNTGKILVR